MKTSEQYEQLTSVPTPKFHFPVQVRVEYTKRKYQFRVFFTENEGQEFATKWLWNFQWFNTRHQLVCDAKLKETEKHIDQQLKRNIQMSLMESRREQQIEAKINRLFRRY